MSSVQEHATNLGKAAKKPTPPRTPKQGPQFKPEQVYTKFKKNPTNPDLNISQENRKAITTEMSQVRQNIKIIEDAATEINEMRAKREVKWVQPLDLTKFEALTRDLKIILTYIEQDMDRFDKAEPGATIPVRAYKLPEGINDKNPGYANFCPLVVFLQALAASLTPLNLDLTNKAGDANPIWQAVKNMEKSLEKVAKQADDPDDPSDPKVCAGLAACVFVHAENGTYTIEGTAPRYTWLEGLGRVASGLRNRHIDVLKTRLSGPDQRRIAEIERVSKQIGDEARGRQGADRDTIRLPDGFERFHIKGDNVSLDAMGRFKPACWTDLLRCVIEMPPHVRELDKAIKLGERNVSSATSCAEYLIILSLLANPHPERPSINGQAGALQKSLTNVPKLDNDEKQRAKVESNRANPIVPQQFGTPRPVTPAGSRNRKAKSESPESKAGSTRTPLPARPAALSEAEIKKLRVLPKK